MNTFEKMLAVKEACMNGDVNLLNSLTDDSLIIEVINCINLEEENKTILHSAAENNYPVECCNILIKCGGNIECKDINGRSPLLIACEKGHEKLVKLLLSYSANIEAVCNDNWSPLRISCARGHMHIVDILIQYGANVEAVDNWERTALILSSQEGHVRYFSLSFPLSLSFSFSLS